MLRSSIKTSRLLVSRPFIRPSNPQQILSCIRQQIPSLSIGSGRRSMAVAANASPTDATMITPGTPISTPTLIDIDKRWLDLNAQQQLDIFKALHEREKEPWYTMTTEERKACTSPHRFCHCLECVRANALETDCVLSQRIHDGLADGVSVLYQFWSSWSTSTTT